MAQLRLNLMITSQTINELLNEEDIEGMLEAGAPTDEYASESNRIASAINALAASQITEESILAIVSLAWMQDFDLDESAMRTRAEAINRVAHRIFKTSK